MGTEPVAFFEQHAGVFAGFYQKNTLKDRYATWTSLIDKYGKPGASVLDAGCGPGVLTQHAAQKAASVLAVDGSEAMLSEGRAMAVRANLSNVSFKRAMLADVPAVALGEFDLVLCSSVVEYMDDLDTTFDVLCAAVAKGGTLLVSMPNFLSLNRHFQKLTFRLIGRPGNVVHIKHMATASGLGSQLERRGMVTQEVRYYGSIFSLAPERNILWPRCLFNDLFVLAARRV